jgi:hypothetical protein
MCSKRFVVGSALRASPNYICCQSDKLKRKELCDYVVCAVCCGDAGGACIPVNLEIDTIVQPDDAALSAGFLYEIRELVREPFHAAEPAERRG